MLLILSSYSARSHSLILSPLILANPSFSHSLILSSPSLTFSFSAFLRQGELVWLTDATPHEAVAMDAAASRQFLRVVTSGLAVWHAAHCTPNPLGVRPGAGVLVLEGGKFDPPEQAE
jgi:hypothetical protein